MDHHGGLFCLRCSRHMTRCCAGLLGIGLLTLTAQRPNIQLLTNRFLSNEKEHKVCKEWATSALSSGLLSLEQGLLQANNFNQTFFVNTELYTVQVSRRKGAPPPPPPLQPAMSPLREEQTARPAAKRETRHMRRERMPMQESLNPIQPSHASAGRLESAIVPEGPRHRRGRYENRNGAGVGPAKKRKLGVRVAEYHLIPLFTWNV